MGLPNVITERQVKPPKGIVYGPPGCGKTTFGANAHKPLLIDCENGANMVACHKTPYLASWQEIRPWIDALANGEGMEYGTIVVDSIDWMLRRVEETVAGVDGTEAGFAKTLARAHGGYGNGKQVLKNYVYQYLLPQFDRIVQSGRAVVLLAHAIRREVTDADGITLTKTQPDIHADLVSTVVEWADFVGAIRVNRDGTRELVLNETPKTVAKNRYGITDPIPATWTDLVSCIK